MVQNNEHMQTPVEAEASSAAPGTDFSYDSKDWRRSVAQVVHQTIVSE